MPNRITHAPQQRLVNRHAVTADYSYNSTHAKYTETVMANCLASAGAVSHRLRPCSNGTPLTDLFIVTNLPGPVQNGDFLINPAGRGSKTLEFNLQDGWQSPELTSYPGCATEGSVQIALAGARRRHRVRQNQSLAGAG